MEMKQKKIKHFFSISLSHKSFHNVLIVYTLTMQS